MTEQNEWNKLIAEFMGGYYKKSAITLILDKDRIYFGEDEAMYQIAPRHERYALKYHTSWDWLMPVVEKIQNGKYNCSLKEFVSDEYGNGSAVTFFGNDPNWFIFYFSKYERLAEEYAGYEKESKKYGETFTPVHRFIVASKLEAVYSAVIAFITRYKSTH